MVRAGPPGEECPRPPAAVIAVLPPHSRQPHGPAPKRQLRLTESPPRAPEPPPPPPPPLPRPDTSWKHGRQSFSANRRQQQEERSEREGAGAAANRGSRAGKRGRGAWRRESPAPHSGHPFPAVRQVLIAGRALASRGRARRVLPLNALSTALRS